VKDLGDKVAAADKTRIEAAIAELKEAAKADDVDNIRAKTTALTQAAMKMGEALYGSGAQAASASGDASPGEGKKGNGAGENVVDADFEEVKDDKKKSA
jgi:molecular chaperone DnaK